MKIRAKKIIKKLIPGESSSKIFQSGSCLYGGNALSRFVKANPAAHPPRTRVPNPFVSSEGKPLLVGVRGDDFRIMLKTGLEKIGGLLKLIDNNQDVFIKPNLNAFDVYPAICIVEKVN